ncbi:MAG: DUF4038 domain-containing protein [Anaerolineae bacterium]|nr:DUF4038 domain-containing protein [Anaerolineae bacterium]
MARAREWGAIAEEAIVQIPRFGQLGHVYQHTGQYANPYVAIDAAAELVAPGGGRRRIPLFWDGEDTWRLRFSPDQVGVWRWTTHSEDAGLDGQSGACVVVPSGLQGSIGPMAGYPHHLQRADGSPFWFLGETAWSLYVDSVEQGHDRAAAERHIAARAAQQFNVFHSMLLSELGWGNCGGDPFVGGDLAAQQINPAYWQEVDRRLATLNDSGIVGGLVLAWGRKRGDDREPFAWDRFTNQAAKERYARYVAARYSAYDVYFVVAGEWNASTRDRDHDVVRGEYVAIGEALRKADPHGRMIGIHPGTGGVHDVREFNHAAGWMSFGDYQQNYVALNAEVIASRRCGKPVINAEYAYYLRDADEDGVVDKPNSQTLDAIRHATWDIVMGGGYAVSGFGSTYLGGARNAGPFDVDAPRNDDWEAQVQHAPALFRSLDWWRLSPRNDLLRAAVARSDERQIAGRPAPPVRTYWCLAEPGKAYVLYVRGMETPVVLSLDAPPGRYALRQFDPRSGAWSDLGALAGRSAYAYRPPDAADWVVVLRAAALAARGP